MRGGAPGRRTLEERLARKTDVRRASVLVEDECWLWTGARTGSDRGGYGLIKLGGGDAVPTLVHRLAYETAYGPLPAGTEVHHRCEGKACRRPSHLVAVTHAENMRLHYAARAA